MQDLAQWIADDFTDLVGRLNGGVRAHVPAERRAEGAGGASILWNTLHIARHASLALTVLTGADWETPVWLADVENPRGGGLHEAEQPWSTRLAVADVDAYADGVLTRVGDYLTPDRVRALDLDAVPDSDTALATAGLPLDEFGWLYAMWRGKAVGWLIRWPLVGHPAGHLGEMIATRGRLGLSPF